MYHYLSVRPNSTYSQFTDTAQVKQFLNLFSEVMPDAIMTYKSRPPFPWLCLMLLVADNKGNYAIRNETDEQTKINLIALVGSQENDREKYLILLRRLGTFLKWQIHDEETDSIIEQF